MNAPPDEIFLVREEPITRLGKIAFALAQASRRCGQEPTEALNVWRVALSAECIQCRMPVAGDELLRLAQLKTDPEPDTALRRLRVGLCAAEGCECSLYRLVLKRNPDLDWAKLLSSHETAGENRIEVGAVERPLIQFVRQAVDWRYARLTIVVLLGLSVLLIRQCYVGGRIPLIREPEGFRVDPGPEPPEIRE